MKPVNFLRRTAVTAVFLVAIVTAAVADTTHVVGRGETLHSIAQKYGVTTEQIIKANPQAAQFVYVGMELTIPGAPAPAPAVQATPAAPARQAESVGNTSAATAVTSQDVAASDDDGMVLSQWGLDYIANFSNNGKGYYGVFSEFVGDGGWGGFLSYGASYGIVKDGQMAFRAGPDFGRRIGRTGAVTMPVTLCLWTFDHVESISTNNKGETTTGESLSLLWGIAATPKLAFKVESLCLNVGLDINYSFKRKMKTEIRNSYMEEKYTSDITYGGKTYVGFFVAIGFNN